MHDDPRVALGGERGRHVDHATGDVDEVDVLGLEHRGAGVEAADLQQVGKQRLEAVELLLEQLGGASGDRVEEGPRVVDHVAGHAHGRDRRTELVGDVGDEPALQAAELLQLADLLLEVGGHLVERRRQPREVVLTGDAQALLQVACGQALGHPARHPDGSHHLAGDQPGQAGDEQEQGHSCNQEGLRDQREGLGLLGEGVEVVEGVGVVVGRQPHLAAHHHPRPIGQAGDVDGGADVGVGPRRRRRGLELRLEARGHARQVEPLGELGAAEGQPAAVADRRGQDHREAAGGAALDDRRHQVVALAGLVDVDTEGGGQGRTRGFGLALGLGHDGLDAVLEQAVARLLDQEGTDDADHGRGEQHGADHHARLDRPPPEAGPAEQDRWQPVESTPAGGDHRRSRTCRPCSPRLAPSRRSRGSRGRARPWTAGAGRGR